MIVKKIISATAIVLGISLSLSAYADGLRIVNDTSLPSSSLINRHILGGVCTASIPFVKGVTPPHDEQTIKSNDINRVCYFSKSNCTAELYMTDNCGNSGAQSIGTVVLDVNSGIKTATLTDSNYSLDWSSWEIKISGGPALASN